MVKNDDNLEDGDNSNGDNDDDHSVDETNY